MVVDFTIFIIVALVVYLHVNYSGVVVKLTFSSQLFNEFHLNEKSYNNPLLRPAETSPR